MNQSNGARNKNTNNMKNLIKYGCYTLLAVVVFTAICLIGGFISMDFDVTKWEPANRFFAVAFTIVIVLPIIGYKETT